MAYTIVLVDDEDEVRGRIASKITGQQDFKVIGSASNGYDALELIEEQIPDVIITDIKMPFIDGIELTRIIRTSYPTIKVAIISGYDDYSYLKEAINLDVVAYLSKPITEENVEIFLNKIKQTIDLEKEHIRLKEDLYHNQIRSRIVYRYLSEHQVSNNEEEMAKEVGIRLSQQHVVISTRLINFSGSMIVFEKKKNQCHLIIEELIDERFKAYHNLFSQDIISVIEVTGENFDKELDVLLYKIMNYIKKYLEVNLLIGVSGFDKFENLLELYRQSQLQLNEYEFDGSNGINYHRHHHAIQEKKAFTLEDIEEFRQNLRIMDHKDFGEYIQQLTHKIKEESAYDYFSIIVTLSGLIVEYTESVGFAIKPTLDINVIKSYIDGKNIDGFIQLLSQQVDEIKAEMATRKTKKSVKIMKDIIGYLEHNYENPEMSMEMVCDAFNISVSYLSALFKKETETTFSRYLVSKRIEQAKLLLRNTDEKMVNIAEQCGYKDVYYFSHSFKKTTGQSPKEYRKNEIN